jgi:hypothetical protein
MEKNKGKPTLKASTFAISTSHHTDQKLQKSLLCPTLTKLFLKNLPTLQKNKNTPTHSQTMTEKLNINRAYSDTVDRRPAGNI